MTELRAALQDALGPLYRVEREVRPVGDCRLFVALERPSGPELLVKVLPGQLSLAVDSGVFEREVLLLAPRLGHPGLVTPKGAGRAGVCGAPYLAPEHRPRGGGDGGGKGNGGSPRGPRDDMFAVGVLAHEMLTGKPPAPEEESLEEVRTVPPWLGELVERCLAADPVSRWADAAAALATFGGPSGGAGGIGGSGGTVPDQ